MRLVAFVAILLIPGCSASPVAAPADAGSDAQSCAFLCGPDIGPETLDASLAYRVEARLALCSGQEGCHVSGAGGLTFPSGDALRNLINVHATERPELFRVAPGDPESSYLYLKVRGDGGIEGGAMPLTQSRDPRIADTIFAWIEAGAPKQ